MYILWEKLEKGIRETKTSLVDFSVDIIFHLHFMYIIEVSVLSVCANFPKLFMCKITKNAILVLVLKTIS
jgi:hypothetical protein